MSYTVKLLDPITRKPVEVERHCEGGTYVFGGTTEARMSVTFNYARIYGGFSTDGLRDLDGKRAGDTTFILDGAIRLLGTKREGTYWQAPIEPDGGRLMTRVRVSGVAYRRAPADYWKATPGNAGHALSVLARWARQYPDAVFEVEG